MKKGMRIKGQTQLSFGMIFSIILIIAFIAFAGYGIKKFLEVKNFAQVESFKSELQGDIDSVWKDGGSDTFEYLLPNKIKQVCFVNDDSENMYFVPLNYYYDGSLIKHIDITKTVKSSTSVPKKLCIPNLDGEVSMVIKREYNESLVTIIK